MRENWFWSTVFFMLIHFSLGCVIWVLTFWSYILGQHTLLYFWISCRVFSGVFKNCEISIFLIIGSLSIGFIRPILSCAFCALVVYCRRWRKSAYAKGSKVSFLTVFDLVIQNSSKWVIVSGPFWCFQIIQNEMFERKRTHF